MKLNVYVERSVSILSIESQGYDTLLAEINEKTWKQKTEQFMKRTKSESSHDLSLYPPPFPPSHPSPLFALLIVSPKSHGRPCSFLQLILVDNLCYLFLFCSRWLNGRDGCQPHYCCVRVVSRVYIKARYTEFVLAHRLFLFFFFFLRALPKRDATAIVENNLLITPPASANLFTSLRVPKSQAPSVFSRSTV